MLGTRVTPEQAARIEEAAALDEMSTAEWIRTILLRAAAVRTGRY